MKDKTKKLKNKLAARLAGQPKEIVQRALINAILIEDPEANRKTRRAIANRRSKAG